MRIFHDSMAARLGAPVCTPLREGAELASDAVEELLAPYKQDNGTLFQSLTHVSAELVRHAFIIKL